MFILSIILLMFCVPFFVFGRQADYKSSLGQPEKYKFVRDENGIFAPKKYIFWSIAFPVLVFIISFFLLPASYIFFPLIIILAGGGYLGFKSASRNNIITGRS